MKVKLEDIIEAIEEAMGDLNMETSAYLNLKTVKIIYNSYADPSMYEIEEIENIEEALDDYPKWQREHIKELYEMCMDEEDNYIDLPNHQYIYEREIMEDFIDSLENESKANQLARCMDRRGMYSMFKDKLYDHNLEKRYYEFRDKKIEEAAIRWCMENDVEYEK